MFRTVVLNVVGLTQDLLGERTPNLSRLSEQGVVRALETITPAVTCSVQATMTTGLLPRDHGIVANGWYFRDLAEVWLWRQSNRLVGGEKIWDAAKRRDPAFTCAKLFWWYNMHSTADVSVTPRPMYPADGRKLPDVYTQPATLRDELNAELGKFPLFRFWGPATDISATRWITSSSMRIYDTHQPTLELIYLPHLDYNLQRLGPSHPDLAADLRDVDALCGTIIDRVLGDDGRVIVLSEYGITEVDGPVHINRALRAAGFIAVRDELGRELLDPGASAAFAVADHQLAHIYIRDPDHVAPVKQLLEALPGVDTVLADEGKRAYGLDHERSGELVAITTARHWFSYYYWLDDERAPDFARTVDIHRKPGYDPVELFIDGALTAPRARIAWRLLQKKLGFRALMDVIGLDASRVRGSHGRLTDRPEAGPLLLSSRPDLIPDHVTATMVKDLVLSHVFD